jgi:hypothetical protein
MQCVGSTQFLKSFYGAGYKLIFDKSPNMNENHVENLSNFVKNYIPDATKIEEAGAEEYLFIFYYFYFYFMLRIIIIIFLLIYYYYC